MDWGGSGMQTTTEAGPGHSPIKKAWGAFWIVLTDPWVVCLLVGSGLLFWLAQKPLQGSSGALVQLLLAASTGVLGGRVASMINTVTGETILRGRGTVAVRMLNVLLKNIDSIEQRTASFLRGARDNEQGGAITERNYEELISWLRALQDQAMSSIDNWTDIVPEARITAENAVLSKVKSLLEERESEVNAVRQELELTKANSEREKQELAVGLAYQLDEVIQRQIEIKKLKDSLATTQSQLAAAELLRIADEPVHELESLTAALPPNRDPAYWQQILNGLESQKRYAKRPISFASLKLTEKPQEPPSEDR